MSLEAPAQFQFQDAARQKEAATLAMWVFLATEVMFFAALFTGYALYRRYYPLAFAACSHHLKETLGTLETAVLLTSSLFMALALHAARLGRPARALGALALTALLGLAFLGIHFTEYREDFLEGALPGRFYRLEHLQLAGASAFFTCYWFMTALHSVHVLVGVGLLGWMGLRTLRGDFGPAYHTPLEMVGLYWHFVDLVWIFLYPLFYLVT